MNETTETKRYEACPVCGSTETVLNKVLKEMKEKGWAREDMKAALEVKKGTLLDPQKAPFIPIGAKVPGYNIEIDVCDGCGILRAVLVEKQYGEFQGLQLPKLATKPFNPNRRN